MISVWTERETFIHLWRFVWSEVEVVWFLQRLVILFRFVSWFVLMRDSHSPKNIKVFIECSSYAALLPVTFPSFKQSITCQHFQKIPWSFFMEDERTERILLLQRTRSRKYYHGSKREVKWSEVKRGLFLLSLFCPLGSRMLIVQILRTILVVFNIPEPRTSNKNSALFRAK